MTDFDHWLENGLYDIKKTLSTLNDVNTNVAKNVIIFVGDGMSLSTVTGDENNLRRRLTQLFLRF